MGLSATEVQRVHRRIAPVDELLGQRRLVYQAVVELLSDPAAATEDDVLENPAVRGHIGAVLSGSATFDPVRLSPRSALVADGCAVDVSGCRVRVASSRAARRDLADALARIEAELGRHGDEECDLQLLGPEDGRFADAFRRVTDGARLAVELVPSLALDLLAHIAVFAVLVSKRSGRLGSASAREFPGIVMLPEPRTPLEVTEAIIHEGAHQKFFDLALTRSMLGPDARRAPRFRPSWSAPSAPDWPLEQTLAAFHAYCCLGVLADAMAARADLAVHAHSLLPHAHVRAAEIAGWLRECGRFVGEDGHALIAGLTGVGPREAPAPGVEVVDAAALVDDVRTSVVRAIGSRTLIAVRGEPVDLMWVTAMELHPTDERSLEATSGPG